MYSALWEGLAPMPSADIGPFRDEIPHTQVANECSGGGGEGILTAQNVRSIPPPPIMHSAFCWGEPNPAKLPEVVCTDFKLPASFLWDPAATLSSCACVLGFACLGLPLPCRRFVPPSLLSSALSAAAAFPPPHAASGRSPALPFLFSSCHLARGAYFGVHSPAFASPSCFCLSRMACRCIEYVSAPGQRSLLRLFGFSSQAGNCILPV